LIHNPLIWLSISRTVTIYSDVSMVNPRKESFSPCMLADSAYAYVEYASTCELNSSTPNHPPPPLT
jgi:hypothetical protein